MPLRLAGMPGYGVGVGGSVGVPVGLGVGVAVKRGVGVAMPSRVKTRATASPVDPSEPMSRPHKNARTPAA